MDLIRAAHTSAPALTVCCIVSGLLKYKQDVLYYFFLKPMNQSLQQQQQQQHCGQGKYIVNSLAVYVQQFGISIAHNVWSVGGTSVISE